VLWTGFLEDPADLAAVYHSADILAVPSNYEPWGVVVTEAAAAGLAVVASSVVGAAADVVEDGVNGRIFRQGDAAHLAECLLDLTRPRRTEAAKVASRDVLTRWRVSSDPVRGLRNALAAAGLNAGSSVADVIA
jgi:glycosyltransferase involved in cell wall biosynthesis